MVRRVVWLPSALADVDAIAAFIASDSRSYALAVLRRSLDSAGQLSTYSERGRIVPEWNDANIREVFVDRLRLIYRVHRDSVQVLTVIHGARLLPDELRFRN